MADRHPFRYCAAGPVRAVVWHGGAQPGPSAEQLVDRLHHAGQLPAGMHRVRRPTCSRASPAASRTESRTSNVAKHLVHARPDRLRISSVCAEGRRPRWARPKDGPAEALKQGVEALMEGDARAGRTYGPTRGWNHGGQLPVDLQRVKAEQHRRMAEPGSGD